MFPQKTKWLKRPIGWEDLGKMMERSEVRDGRTIILITTHALCNSALHAGKEEDKLFRFCPRCLVKIK